MDSPPAPEPQIEVVVRPSRDDEAGVLAEFLEPFVQQRKILPRTLEEIAMLVRHGFVAERSGRIVGFAALEIYSSKLAEVRSLVVADEVQGRGVGKRLVEACLDRARERQILEVMAISSAENFFLSCGFKFTLPEEKKAFFVQTRET